MAYVAEFYPSIYLPTRCSLQSATLIDNIFTSNPSLLTSGIICCDLTHHFSVFIAFADPYKCNINSDFNNLSFCCSLSKMRSQKLNNYL